ncbi:MAG TPA: hypothetical protein VE987_20760 [Polyangiaceae bacterium]|nr:hypothetical protein [Polyangiaceae bacterium]
MASRKWKGLLASGMVVGAVAILGNGCSSSSNGGPSDGGGDGSPTHPPMRLDSGTDAGGVVSNVTFDGTTGRPCSSNADCKGDAGTNVCSTSYTFTINAVTVQLWPTPVCLMQLAPGVGNCDPGPPGAMQFCDSADPTDVTSPGICLPATTPQQAGPMNGICFPACHFALDGTPPLGCTGKDTCVPLNFLLDTNTGAVTAYGVCQGTCQADADCSALGTGWGCQTDLGFCTRAKKTRSKPIGTPCTNAAANTTAATDSTSGACNCFALSSLSNAYCTSSCVVGGTPCPNGWVCEAFEPSTVTFSGAAADGGDIVTPGPPMPTQGLSGLCMPPCANPDGGVPEAGPASDGGADGATDGGADGAGAALECPASSVCTAGTVVGPDCQPM